MKVGDLVKVETKYYGTKIGLIVKNCQFHGLYVQPSNHTRMIIALEEDCEVVSESR